MRVWRAVTLWAILCCTAPPPGRAEPCLRCHAGAEFRRAVAHGPLSRRKGCERCHRPHASRYAKLLVRPVPTLCHRCHPETQRRLRRRAFAHPPAAEGKCLTCHEPHSSTTKGLLRQRASALCGGCHRETQRRPARVHPPFAQGRCVACHDPHASDDHRLLAADVPALCLRCHRGRLPARAHRGVPPRRLPCLSCHAPHGSARAHLVRDRLHPPFARRQCSRCHAGPQGTATCLQCHPQVSAGFYTTHHHLLGGDNPCTRCHSPHASEGKGLLLDELGKLCQRCHPDAYRRRRQSAYVHPNWERCTDCHLPHGSDNPSLLKGDGVSACTGCHPTQGKFTHPVGERYRDPRNGQSITCVTCHDPMGTDFKFDLRLSGERALCVQCHRGY